MCQKSNKEIPQAVWLLCEMRRAKSGPGDMSPGPLFALLKSVLRQLTKAHEDGGHLGPGCGAAGGEGVGADAGDEPPVHRPAHGSGGVGGENIRGTATMLLREKVRCGHFTTAGKRQKKMVTGISLQRVFPSQEGQRHRRRLTEHLYAFELGSGVPWTLHLPRRR